MIRFVVDGQMCSLQQHEAEALASALHALGIKRGDGSAGALFLAYVLQDAIVDDDFRPIPLNGPAAEAVYSALNVDSFDPNSDTRYAELWRAVRRSTGRAPTPSDPP